MENQRTNTEYNEAERVIIKAFINKILYFSDPEQTYLAITEELLKLKENAV